MTFNRAVLNNGVCQDPLRSIKRHETIKDTKTSKWSQSDTKIFFKRCARFVIVIPAVGM
jgi:hypothetical protein